MATKYNWGIDTAKKYFDKLEDVLDNNGKLKNKWQCKMRVYESEITCDKCILLDPGSGYTNLKNHHNKCCGQVGMTSPQYIERNQRNYSRSLHIYYSITLKSCANSRISF